MSGTDNRHLTIADWRRYIRNEMTLSEREQADQELHVCEGCMWLFMEAMDEGERSDGSDMPDLVLPDMARLEDRIMAELSSERPAVMAFQPAGASDEPSARAPKLETVTAARDQKRQGSWLQHPITHYTIAASITLLLVSTGALAGFSEKLQHLEELESTPQTISAEWAQEPSWSDRIVDKAGHFLDDVQTWRFK